MKTKHCKYCNKTKPCKDFRTVTHKRIKTPFYVFFSNKCKLCEVIERKERNARIKNDPELNKAHVAQSREYNIRTGYAKKRYQKNKNSDHYKNYITIWRKKNAVSIKIKQSIVTKEWFKKHRDNITEIYCIQRLRAQFPELTIEFFKSNPDYIELKRSEILMYRMNKLLKKIENE